jgi:glycine/D-amino acid oxidase-like deaminating enzyme
MRTVSDNFWLDAPYEAGPMLWGEHEADVAIIGGGFTGMAAAYFIKQYFPAKKIIVLESEFVGFGYSGRNSGMVTSLLGGNIVNVLKAKGVEETAKLNRLGAQSLSLVEDLIEKHGIDCDFEKNGSMAVAETDKEVRLLERTARAYEDIGAKTIWLEGEKARHQFGGTHISAALLFPEEGMLNPAKFIRGMKRAAESLGVEVYEHSRCARVESGAVMSLYTPGGLVRAEDVVIATNAYGNPLGLLRYKVLPFYVYDIVTEPLIQPHVDALQLPGRENVAGIKHLGWGMRFTADNRILFTEVDALYFRSIDRDYSHCPREYRSHYQVLIKKFPFLKDIKVTHQWGGRVGITFDFLPSIGRTGRYENVYHSIGYTAMA